MSSDPKIKKSCLKVIALKKHVHFYVRNVNKVPVLIGITGKPDLGVRFVTVCNDLILLTFSFIIRYYAIKQHSNFSVFVYSVSGHAKTKGRKENYIVIEMTKMLNIPLVDTWVNLNADVNVPEKYVGYVIYVVLFFFVENVWVQFRTMEVYVLGEPANCLDIKLMNKIEQDGEYVISILGRNITIWCHDMQSSQPKEYLSLALKSSENYSEYYSRK